MNSLMVQTAAAHPEMFWLTAVLCAGSGLLLAVFDESLPQDSHGASPAAHISVCADSCKNLFSDLQANGAGLGLLEPLWQIGTPDGRRWTLLSSGIGGLLASLVRILGSIAWIWQSAPAKAPEKAHKEGEPSAPEGLNRTKWVEWQGYMTYFKMFIMAVTREYAVRFKASVLGDKLSRDFLDREKWDNGWVDFFKAHCYMWLVESFNRPISSSPDAIMDVVQRTRPGGWFGSWFSPLQHFTLTEEKRRCVNLGSYNYLGFGGVNEYCLPSARVASLEFGFSSGGSRTEGGTMPVHLELEREVAKFLQKEDAFVMGMGFATNAAILPALFEAKGSDTGILVISDELNHRSIVEGIRLSGATVRAFAHNSMKDLEAVLKRGVGEGQPNGKPWKKIFVVVEGIYSMEGDFCRLREIVTLKNRYKAYLYLDEAHSIGGVGPTGRGISELFGVPTSEIDIMMGTFTKSFGSAGGYVAASKAVINAIRKNAPGSCFASAMSPPCAVQALAALRVISGATAGSVGAQKLASVKNNSNYFRKRMIDEGFRVLGDLDSTIVPVMIFVGRRMAFFTKMCMDRGIAVVVVGYPAVPILNERVRFCISAAHTIDQLEKVVSDLIVMGKELGLLFDKTSDQKVLEDRRSRRDEYDAWLRNAPLVPAASVKFAPEAEQWTPEPIAPTLHAESSLLDAALVAATTAEARCRLDFKLFDPLGYLDRHPPKSKAAVNATLDVYGFGACGPRGFYGTTLPHLELEAKISEVLKVPDTIAYSAGVATISSVIPAHIQSTDRVVTDTEIHLGIRSGLRLSKCKVDFCPPGDLAAMEAALLAATKVKDPKKASTRRVFIIAEAISQRTGRICPLVELLALKEKYGALLILDESLSFGTLGEHGGGLCELTGVNVSRVDAVVGSLEHAVAGVGGFCSGRTSLISHQRLSGAGYCYSAAKPPAACSAAVAAISDMSSEEGMARRRAMRSNAAKLHEELRRIIAEEGEALVQLTSCAESYVQHLRWKGTASHAYEKLQAWADSCRRVSDLGVQVCAPGLCGADGSFNARIGAPEESQPSLRLCVSEKHSVEDITAASVALRQALKAIA